MLVLDEPSNGLDPEGIRWMRSLLRHLAEEGRTVLISSHLLAEVQQTVDALLIISRGRLVFQGGIEDLADPDEYATVVDSPDRAALSRLLDERGIDYQLLRNGFTIRHHEPVEIGGLAAAAGIALSNLQSKGASLEDIFLELVSGARVHASAGGTSIPTTDATSATAATGQRPSRSPRPRTSRHGGRPHDRAGARARVPVHAAPSAEDRVADEPRPSTALVAVIAPVAAAPARTEADDVPRPSYAVALHRGDRHRSGESRTAARRPTTTTSSVTSRRCRDDAPRRHALRVHQAVHHRRLVVLGIVLMVYVAFTAGLLAFVFGGVASGRLSGGTGPAMSADGVPALVYSTASAVGYVFPLLIGTLMVTTEFRHKTLTPTFLSTPRRGVVLGGKFVVGILVGLLYGVLGSLAAIAAGGGRAEHLRDRPELASSDTWWLVGRMLLAFALLGRGRHRRRHGRAQPGRRDRDRARGDTVRRTDIRTLGGVVDGFGEVVKWFSPAPRATRSWGDHLRRDGHGGCRRPRVVDGRPRAARYAVVLLEIGLFTTWRRDID